MALSIIGFKLIFGPPTTIVYIRENETSPYPTLLIPEVEDIKQDKSIVAEKGVYSPNRNLRISRDVEPYIAKAKLLIDSTYNFEQFNFKTITIL